MKQLAAPPQPMRFRHVVVEGPIGVGKTTLCHVLAREWAARLVLEKPADNPWLEKYYAHGARRGNPFALQTQLSFLFQRVEQMRELTQSEMAEPGVVSDFLFAKDSIFAMLTLTDEDLAMYRQVYRRQAAPVREPDLVIWLQAEPAVLMRRIHRRGLAMEREGIGEEYLQQLCDAYHDFFKNYTGAPVLAVNTEAFHPASNAGDRAKLLDAIGAFRGPFEFLDPPDDPGR
jgi:deoxyadenosine/deoxycytidine kinase